MFLKKEAEMRIVKFAGILSLLAVSAAMATDGVITYNVANNSGLTTLPNTGANPVLVKWVVDVVVTGNNQGLGGFQFAMGCYKAGEVGQPGKEVPYIIAQTAHQNLATITAAMPYARQWTRNVFKSSQVPSLSGKCSIIDDATNGGPGMPSGTPPSSTGSPAGSVGYIDQIGDAYLNNDLERFLDPDGVPDSGDEYWTGTTNFGIGRADAKTRILQNSAGKYRFINGQFDVRGWAPGTYVLAGLLPPGMTSGNSVIDSAQDLNVVDTGPPSFDPVPVSKLDLTTVSGGVAFTSLTFIVTPEPATLLLLAGAAMLYRRRSA